MKETGCIYILTNPSFKEYVKIGYATNLEKRLRQLNRSETIPFAFRAYAIYEVDKPLTDKELHKLIDRLNPDLRTIDNFDGKERVKEFFLMSPEDAYAILESIAKISGTIDRLKKVKPEGHEIEDEIAAEENQKAARRGPFRFGECGIPNGAELVYVDAGDPTAHTAFKSKSFRTLAGLGTIAIRMTGTGKATVRVRSKGLKGFKLIINYDGTSMTVTPKLPMFF